MKGTVFILSILLTYLSTQVSAQQQQFPVIKNYGGVFNDVPGVSFRADKQIQYKVVIEVDNSDTAGSKVSNSLEVVSRYINLLAIDGITTEKRSIVVIFHNAGSYCIQNNEAYQRKYGKPNPNLDVLDQLEKAGVLMYICGQSTVKRKILPTDIIPAVKIATSYLTTYTTYQLKGYATLKM
jgi:intracellular sulfur oxidation DsrE/DsrF family protein